MPLSAPRDSSIVSALSPTAEEPITLPRVYHPQTVPTGAVELAVEGAVVYFFGGVFFATAYFATSDLFMALAAVGGFTLCFAIVALVAWFRFPKSIQTIEIRDEGLVLNLRGGTQEFIRRESLRSIRTLTLWEYFISCYITPHHRHGPGCSLRHFRIDHSDGFICFRPRGDDSFAPMIRALLQPPDPDRPVSLPATAIGTPRELNLHTGTLCTISALGIAYFLFAGFLWGWLFVERGGDLASLYHAQKYAEIAKRFVVPFATCLALLTGFLVALVFSWTEKQGASWLVLGCVGVASVAFVTEIYFRMW